MDVDLGGTPFNPVQTPSPSPGRAQGAAGPWEARSHPRSPAASETHSEAAATRAPSYRLHVRMSGGAEGGEAGRVPPQGGWHPVTAVDRGKSGLHTILGSFLLFFFNTLKIPRLHPRPVDCKFLAEGRHL